MKYLKTYNESIRHLLKPKSEEHILKSLDGESLEEQFRLLLIYNLYDATKEVGSKIKNYFNIDYLFFYGLIGKKKPVIFNDNDVDLIGKQIKTDNNNRSFAHFGMIEGGHDPIRQKMTSLYINDNGYIYFINNYNHFITIYYLNNNKKIKLYYICPDIKHLIKFLDDNLIKVNQIY